MPTPYSKPRLVRTTSVSNYPLHPEYNETTVETRTEQHVLNCTFPTVKTNEWKLRRSGRKVWVPPTGYHREELHVHFDEGHSFTVFPDGSSMAVSGPLYELSDYDTQIPGDIGKSVNIAENRALGDLSNLNVNWGEGFATRLQTSEMVGNAISEIARIALMIRRGQWRELHRLIGRPGRRVHRGLTVFSDLWLQYQYGWAPFCQDIYNAVMDIHARDSEFEDRQRYAIRARGSFNDKYESVTTVSLGGNRFREIHRKTDYHAVCKFYLTNGTAAEQFGRSLDELGCRNPALLAWELLPASFVVDWVLPFGSYLESMSADYGLHFLGGSTSVKRTHTRTINEYLVSATSSSKDWRHKEHSEELYYDRTGLTSVPKFHLMAKNPFSPTHMLNAIALLRSVFLR